MPISMATKKRINQELTDSRLGLLLTRRRGLVAGFCVLASAMMLADSDAALSSSLKSERIWSVALDAACESVTVSAKISRLDGIPVSSRCHVELAGDFDCAATRRNAALAYYLYF